MILPLAGVTFIMKATAILWLFVAICLILLILIQKGRGGGLSGAFGGAGGAGSLLGTKTGDFLTWVTISLVVLFLLLAIVLVKFYRPTSSEDLSLTSQTATQQQASEVPETPVQQPQVPEQAPASDALPEDAIPQQ